MTDPGRRLFEAKCPPDTCAAFPAWEDLNEEEKAYFASHEISWDMLREAYKNWPTNIKARVSIYDLANMTWSAGP